MDAETWMDANKAVELGFADDIMVRAKTEPKEESEEDEEDTNGSDPEEEEKQKKPPAPESMLFSRRAVNNALLNKMAAKYGEAKPKPDMTQQAGIPAGHTETGRPVSEIMERLSFIKKFI